MAKRKESYESTIKKLEKIIGEMENEELSLEGSLKNYEDGVKLCNKLYKMLNDSETKIKILTEQGEKDFVEVDE
ncbi:exodeoxyribonuclease VII small subunit [Clostridium aestuarii]|uniref:Exodeoxyribonuclease 7 small subunit n=1 Tax=Clostridium aestuarii TaxID=338193 RepID=A0ABT4CXQ8_9CLOT|nr:exodeoxyribonuclease VII small subunit [Clostridium aestuarii]MCY6483761.1 exodeoxyribonuclease VII small subunit [Clostridium aestuarii]